MRGLIPTEVNVHLLMVLIDTLHEAPDGQALVELITVTTVMNSKEEERKKTS